MQKITPFWWFDGKAGEAMNFYVSIFKTSKIVNVTRMDERDGHERDVPASGPGILQTQRVMKAMLQMDKIDIQRLKQAFEQG